jgi:hypothetical protein
LLVLGGLLSSTNAKSLNIMKQKLKKHNAQFEEQLKNVRAKPEDSSEDEEEEVIVTAPKKGGKNAKKAAKLSDSEAESDAESESSEAVAERRAAEEDAKFEKMRSKQDKKKEREFDVDPDQVTFTSAAPLNTRRSGDTVGRPGGWHGHVCARKR